MRIYVAGGSSEYELVSSYMTRLEDAGHVITHDWTRLVRAYGGNPPDATDIQRAAWSNEDLRAVESSELVWLLMPERASFGAGVEVGFACAKNIPFIVSGRWTASIFSAFAAARCDTHEEALRGICLYQIGADNVRRNG